MYLVMCVDRISHKPSHLSVGEQQRVAVARALITNSHIVFANESTAHLGNETGKKIVCLMKQLQEDFDITFIVSTYESKKYFL